MDEAAWLLARKRQRSYIALGIMTVTMSIAAFALKGVFYEVIRRSLEVNDVLVELILTLIPVVIGLSGAYLLLIAYLRYDPQSLVELKAISVPKSDGTAPGQSVFIGESLEQITVPEQEDVPLNSVEVDKPWMWLTQDEKIDFLFDSTQTRLRREVRALGRRSNVNLSFGVTITVLGIGILVYLVVKQQPADHTLPVVLSHYLPRISTVALIEAFAYFFLNLYKADLEEIKYYQNVRTTSTDLQIAWIAATGEEKTKTAAFVIQQLSQRDRNASVGVRAGKGKGAATIDVAALLKIMSKITSEATSKNGKEE